MAKRMGPAEFILTSDSQDDGLGSFGTGSACCMRSRVSSGPRSRDAILRSGASPRAQRSGEAVTLQVSSCDSQLAGPVIDRHAINDEQVLNVERD